MSGTKKRAVAEAKSKRPIGGFVPMSYIVIRAKQWTRMSAHGCKLLFDLLAQYNGKNNGDFCATWSMMEKRGWRSRDTLHKALRELEQQGWIARTRQGGLHAPTLYGVTIFALDWKPKMDISEKAFPRGAWATTMSSDLPRKGQQGQHAGRANYAAIDTPAVS